MRISNNVPHKLKMKKNYFNQTETEDVEIEYQLKSFICRLEQPKHFITFRHEDGIWFLCDDDKIRAASRCEVKKNLREKAYILYYEKI
jgi:ubiquitin C-terminal hydrolase